LQQFSPQLKTARMLYLVYTMKQTSSKHRANVKQTSSKYEACIKHSLCKAIIKQTSSKRQAIRAHVVHVYFECICLMIA